MNKIKEGELYRVIELFGHKIELRYGYYEERERERGEPIPIYPNFKENPLYSDEGFPLVTQMQELCIYGSSKFSDGCCADCEFFENADDLIGVCKNANNKKEKS